MKNRHLKQILSDPLQARRFPASTATMGSRVLTNQSAGQSDVNRGFLRFDWSKHRALLSWVVPKLCMAVFETARAVSYGLAFEVSQVPTRGPLSREYREI